MKKNQYHNYLPYFLLLSLVQFYKLKSTKYTIFVVYIKNNNTTTNNIHKNLKWYEKDVALNPNTSCLCWTCTKKKEIKESRFHHNFFLIWMDKCMGSWRVYVCIFMCILDCVHILINKKNKLMLFLCDRLSITPKNN